MQPRAAQLAAGLAVAAGLGVGGWHLLHAWGPVRVGAPRLAQAAAAPIDNLNPTDGLEEETFADSTQTRTFSEPDVIPAAEVGTAVSGEAPDAGEAIEEAPALATPGSALDVPAVVPVADSLGPQ